MYQGLGLKLVLLKNLKIKYFAKKFVNELYLLFFVETYFKKKKKKVNMASI